jgi:hypothetical protein
VPDCSRVGSLKVRFMNRVLSNLENLENLGKSGNCDDLEMSGKSQGICLIVRENFLLGRRKSCSDIASVITMFDV